MSIVSAAQNLFFICRIFLYKNYSDQNKTKYKKRSGCVTSEFSLLEIAYYYSVTY